MTDHNQAVELVRCALNRYQTTVTTDARRWRVVAGLIDAGLMTPERSADPLPHAPGTPIGLTDAGRAAVLAIDPASFADRRRTPLPQDVRHAQELLRGDEPPWLDAEEEAMLDAVWDRIGREDRDAGAP